MVNIAKHIRIFITDPSDDLVDKRTAAITKLTAALSKKGRLPEILQLASSVAAGVIDPNRLSTTLATEVEAAIKERSTAFDRDGNELEVLICLLLAMCLRLENHEAGATLQSSNESWAAAVWSALSFQPSRSEPKLEALRHELMAKAQALVLASGENSRRRLEVPDFSIEGGDESDDEDESQEDDIAQFKEDFMAGTEATIEALRTNADLDREELDLLWWALGDWSGLLDMRLSTLSAPTAAVTCGIEIGRALRKLPASAHKHLALRNITEDAEPLNLPELIEAIGTQKEKLLSAFANRQWLSEFPEVFPLLHALQTGRTSADGSNQKRSLRDWGARALLETSILFVRANDRAE
ncbi:hypothetical protein KSF73_09805 [Burkholderiaceae bacterium DAT-1]|nr:hypothetical protein [Burkholderiaceae bacterium DAT-1]